MKSESLREVERYLLALSRVRAAVRRLHPEVHGMAGFYRLYRERVVNKSGIIHDGLEYNFHGFGCRFIEAGHAEIDVEFLNDGTEAFDPWRVRMLSESVGDEPSGSLEGIANMCRELVTQGRLTEAEGGWFSVMD